MEFNMILGAWVSVFFTLAIFSLLYKDSFIFKLAENIYIGVSLGYVGSIALYQALKPLVWHKLFDSEGSKSIKGSEQIIIVLACIGGLLLFARFIPTLQWLSRWTMAFLIGYTAGIVIPSAIDSFLLAQVSKTIAPISFSQESISSGATFQQLLILVGVISVLLYFFFSSEQKGVLIGTSKIALVLIIIYLGGLYGATVMGRLSLLYGRISDLVTFSGSSYFYASFVLLVLFILFFFITSSKKQPEQHE
ncbi:MAG: hypothetical protein HY606_13970 [Planctomycetes bacterium]|nr:hypothetical protein [Planctomycetota bacterium]